MSCDLFKRRARKYSSEAIKRVFLLPLLFPSMNSDELDLLLLWEESNIRSEASDSFRKASYLSAAVAADVWHDFICDRGRHHAQTHSSRRVQTQDGGGSRTLQTSPSYTARIIALICLLTGEHRSRKNAQFHLSANVLVTNSSLFIVRRLCSKPAFLHV